MPAARQSGGLRGGSTACGKQGIEPERDRPRGRQKRAAGQYGVGALRLAEVVRYDSDGKRNRYRLKHPAEVRSVIAALSRFVKVASAVGRQ